MAMDREDAIKFLECACRNWKRLPKLSDEDIEDVRAELERFSLKAILKAREEAFEEHRQVIQKLYGLLHNDTSDGGAASYLPAGGVECERLVDEALDILRENGAIRHHSQKGER